MERPLHYEANPHTLLAQGLEALGSILLRGALVHYAKPRPPAPRKWTSLSAFFREVDGALTHLLADWCPTQLPYERDYHDDLEAFFRARLPQAIIRREPNHNGGRPDFIIDIQGLLGGSVIVELKTHIRSNSACQRLVGQVLSYQAGGHRTVVVLSGTMSRRRVAEIEKSLREHAPSALSDGSILLVDRTAAAIATTRERDRRDAAAVREVVLSLAKLYHERGSNAGSKAERS
jgi:hypothetical protein